MGIREKIEALIPRLAAERQFTTQGETLFVDLERREVRHAFIPKRVVTSLLGGRGVNMFLLYNLLDETLHPRHPEIPMIFGTGLLTSFLPSAARGNVTSWSPESGVLMDGAKPMGGRYSFDRDNRRPWPGTPLPPQPPRFAPDAITTEVIALQAAEQFERYTGVRPTPEQIAEASRVSRA